MFRCQKCKRVKGPGEAMVKVVVETREKVYPERYALIDPERPDSEKNRVLIDKGGKGYETVREVCLCHRCANPS